jgi:diketogulonate reductase-like aldo/keto reductase
MAFSIAFRACGKKENLVSDWQSVPNGRRRMNLAIANTVVEIAKEAGKSRAQVALNWLHTSHCNATIARAWSRG